MIAMGSWICRRATAVFNALTANEALTCAPAASNNPVRKSIFDRTKIQLAFPGVVLGDIGQPHLVDAGSGVNKVMTSYPVSISMGKMVIMDRGAWAFTVFPPLLPIRGPQPLL